MKRNQLFKLEGGFKVIAALCVLSLLFFSACEKETEESTRFALKDNPTNLQAPSQGISQTFTVETAGAWSVEPLREERWLKIEPRQGNGGGTFSVTVDRNTTLEERHSVLTFVVDGKIQNYVLRIDQDARSASDQDNGSYVNLNGLSSLSIPDEGLNERMIVRSTGEWRIEIIEGDDWLSISPMEGRYDAGVNVGAGVNAATADRHAKLVFYLNGVQMPDVFEITQEGMEVILFEDFSWLSYGSPIFYTTTGEKRIDGWTADELGRGWGWHKTSADGIPSTYARDGFVKLGKTNYGADILSPKLSAIEGTKNVQVTFKAVPYQTAGGTRDNNLLKVGVTGPGTVSVNEFTIDNWPNYSVDPNCTEIWKAPETTRTFTITGATADTQIWFLGGAYDLRASSDWPGSRNVCRIFLDDILVTPIK